MKSALKTIHKLQALAHVIDMHQLARDSRVKYGRR